MAPVMSQRRFEERQRQLVELRLVACPQWLEIGHGIQRSESRDVVVRDQLQMRELVTGCRTPVRSARGLDRIQGLGHSAIAERMEMHGEPHRIQRGGVGRRCSDAGQHEGAGVHPHPVVIAVAERHGTVGQDGIECLAGRRAAGKELHRPACVDDPGFVGVRGGKGRDDAQAVLGVGCARQVALQQLDAGLDRVHVRVLKAGQQHAAREVDCFGCRTAQVVEAAGLGHRDDRAGSDGDILRPRALPACCEYGAAEKDHVGVGLDTPLHGYSTTS